MSKKIFISYSHKDETYKDALITHLTSLKRRGMISEWNDRLIDPGQEFNSSINENLMEADIILLLISPDFISSNYCYEIETSKALERHQRKEAIVIPIILRNCDWNDLPFGNIQALPKDGKPVSEYTNTDQAFLEIITGIKKAVVKLDENVQDSTIDIIVKDQELVTEKMDEPYIIYKMPRGFLIIKEFEYNKHPSWAIIIDHYGYNGEWIHSTHYHSSYKRSWEDDFGFERQCKKLHIPIADWHFAFLAFELVIELRGRTKDDELDSIIKDYTKYEEFDYIPKGSSFSIPKLPKHYEYQNKTGELRDIMEELTVSSWRINDVQKLNEHLKDLRRKTYYNFYNKLGAEHPVIYFLKEAVAKFNDSMSISELRSWAFELNAIIIDSIDFLTANKQINRTP